MPYRSPSAVLCRLCRVRQSARAVAGKRHELLAGLAAVLFYLARRHMLQTIVFGMLVLTVLRVFPVFGAGG